MSEVANDENSSMQDDIFEDFEIQQIIRSSTLDNLPIDDLPDLD